MSNQEQSKRQQVLDIFQNDIIGFGKFVTPNRFYLPSPSVHYEITSLFLNTVLQRLNIIAPRGVAKTALVTIYILHHLFFTKGPKVVAIISKTQTHSKSILNTIKNIIEYSSNFRKLFGYHGEQVAKVWREDKIVLPSGDAVVARGTGQAIRGIGEDLQRPTLIVIDDPEDENNTKTIESMENNFNYVIASCVPALDPQRGRIIAIGTPLHERCIVMRLKDMTNWTTVHFGNDLANGIALWPESKSLEALTSERESLQQVGKVRLYYQEYECNLIPGEDAMFRESDIRYYNEDMKLERIQDEWYMKFPYGEIMPVSVYMGIDPASSISQTADYSAIVPVAITASDDIYVLDYFRKRVAPLGLVEAIEMWYKRFMPRLTLIECTGYQDMLRQYLRSRIFIPGLEYKENPRDSKSNRLEMLQPYVAQHKLFVKKSQKDLIDELILFPKSRNDDLLDGLYYACKRKRTPSHYIEPPKETLPEYQQVLVEYLDKQEEDHIPLYYDPFNN